MPRSNPERRTEVLRLLGRGLSQKDIAEKIGVSPTVVSYYVTSSNMSRRKRRRKRSNGSAPARRAPESGTSRMHAMLLDYARPYIMAEVRERLGR